MYENLYISCDLCDEGQPTGPILGIQASSTANKTKHYCGNFRYITFIYTENDSVTHICVEWKENRANITKPLWMRCLCKTTPRRWTFQIECHESFGRGLNFNVSKSCGATRCCVSLPHYTIQPPMSSALKPSETVRLVVVYRNTRLTKWNTLWCCHQSVM